jgi:hypothetical protein
MPPTTVSAAAQDAGLSGRPDEDDRDHEFRGHQHLHGRQWSRPQCDRVRREAADLREHAKQPQGLTHQQEQQAGPSSRRLGCRGRLPLLHRRTGPVEHGGDQRGRDHHHHGNHARSDG